LSGSSSLLPLVLLVGLMGLIGPAGLVGLGGLIGPARRAPAPWDAR
jgi:hypothetical protein